MYATLHDYKTWWSTELVSAWDLEAAWNKIPLLYILMHPDSPVTQGIEWLLWMDDDAIFTDMNFTFPFEEYDAAGINLVIWGDPQRVFRANVDSPFIHPQHSSTTQRSEVVLPLLHRVV